jgi:hypothetical protein
MANLPIKKPIFPTDLKGRSNGLLPKELLRPIKPTGQMHHTAARAWHALRAAAWKDGILLSLSQGYRTYAQQEALFKQRYTTNVLAGRPTKTWQGKTWYQLPKTAMAAVPGTSNHGWALALDLAIDADGDEAFEWPVKSIDKKAVEWLLKNANRFGFAWELQSEPWHLVYVVGDAVPQAVLDFENGVVPPMPSVDKVEEGLEAAKKFKLKLGSGGSKATVEERNAVIWLQTLLNKHGASVLVDGDFGKKTDAAVRDFQRRNINAVGVADGQVGPKTWAALTR